MSSEQLFSQAFRLDGYFLDNASILFQAAWKKLEVVSKIICFAWQGKTKNLTAHYFQAAWKIILPFLLI